MPLRVYIEDTDVGGIVYYVNYLKYMERARTEMLRTIAYQESQAHEEYQFVVHSCQINYRASARMDDFLKVTAAIIRKGRAYLLFEQKVLAENGNVLCEAELKIACIDSQNRKPVSMPQSLIDDLAGAGFVQ